MNSIIFITSGVLLVLVILAKIPGLEHMVRPTIDLVFTGVKVVFENAGSWAIWAFKILWSAHIELVRNLVLPAAAIDPSVEIREAAEAGG